MALFTGDSWSIAAADASNKGRLARGKPVHDIASGTEDAFAKVWPGHEEIARRADENEPDHDIRLVLTVLSINVRNG